MTQDVLTISVDYSEVEEATEAMNGLAEAIERVNRLALAPIRIKSHAIPDVTGEEALAILQARAAAKRAVQQKPDAQA